MVHVVGRPANVHVGVLAIVINEVHARPVREEHHIATLELKAVIDEHGFRRLLRKIRAVLVHLERSRCHDCILFEGTL
jgi:hypothetical protein